MREKQIGAGGPGSFTWEGGLLPGAYLRKQPGGFLLVLVHLFQLVLVGFARGAVMKSLSWLVLFESVPDRVWLLALGALNECEFLNAAVEVFSEMPSITIRNAWCTIYLFTHCKHGSFAGWVLFPAMIQECSAAQLCFHLQMTFLTSCGFHYAYWS